MSLVDNRNILCDKQVITDTTLSQRQLDMVGQADYSVGANLYVHCIAQGVFEKDLRVQVLGSTDTTFASPILLGDSGVQEASKLVQGYDFFVRIGETGEKYRYICLRLIPSTDGNETTTVSGSDTPDVSNFALPDEVGVEPTAVANGLRAFIEPVAALGRPVYGYANADKTTA